MIDLYLCIVVYNKDFTTSPTLQSIKNLDPSIRKWIKRIYLWDNSAKSLNEEDIRVFQKDTDIEISYFWNGKNNYLSFIYNKTIEKVPENSILVLLDHDSCIGNDYFVKLKKDAERYENINLFLPIIKYNNQVVSPAWQVYFYGQYLKKVTPGLEKSKHKMAINSGMAIRSNYLKNTFRGYNEEIKFYGTDNDFMSQYARDNKYFVLLDTVIEHELNYYENTNREDILRRLADMKNGSYILMKKENQIIYNLAKLYWYLYEKKIIHGLNDKSRKG